VFRMPLPSFSMLGLEMLHFQYIDDFGGIAIDMGDKPERSIHFLSLCRAALKKAGLGCHKESTGFQIRVLGVEIGYIENEDEIILEPTAKKYHCLQKGTTCLVKRGWATGKEVEQVVGHWIGVMVIFRLYLSVFSNTYKFIREFRNHKKRQKLWESVKSELAVAVALLPLCVAVLTAGWCPFADCVDASGWGAAALQSRAKVPELRRESKWAEDKGWFVPPGPGVGVGV